MCYILEMSPEDIFNTISQMKRILTRIIFVIAVVPAAVSCFNRSGKAVPKDPSTAVIDSLAAGEPFRLCEQTVTSIDALANITDTTSHSYDRETTPMEQAFFFLPQDLTESGTAKLLMRRYNLCAVINHVVHSYELFCRKSS